MAPPATDPFAHIYIPSRIAFGRVLLTSWKPYMELFLSYIWGRRLSFVLSLSLFLRIVTRRFSSSQVLTISNSLQYFADKKGTGELKVKYELYVKATVLNHNSVMILLCCFLLTLVTTHLKRLIAIKHTCTVQKNILWVLRAVLKGSSVAGWRYCDLNFRQVVKITTVWQLDQALTFNLDM